MSMKTLIKTKKRKKMTGWTRKLGLFGLEGIETGLEIGLVTQNPLLFVGRHGTGKTLLVKRIAQALGLKFHSYDASKSLFEDVIGFPDPNKMKEGKIEYLPTPLSIFDKEIILIDEISRANPVMQNKWLEIIRERTIMGIKIKTLKYIFAAMNPPDYPGAFPLEPALADRFALIIPFPSSLEIGNENIKKIFSLGGENILNGNGIDPEVSEILKFKIKKARKKLRDKKLKEEAKSFVIFLWDKISELISQNSRFYISQRRLRFILSNIEAYLALKGRSKMLPEDREELFKIVKWSIPDGVTEEVKEAKSLEFFIDEIVYSYFDVNKKYSECLESILPLRELISKSIQRFIESDDISEYVNAFSLLIDFWKKIQSKELFVDADTLALILDNLFLFSDYSLTAFAEITDNADINFQDKLFLEALIIYTSRKKRGFGFGFDLDLKEVRNIRSFLKTRRN